MKAKLAFTMRHLYDSLRELMLTLPSRISKSTIALVVLFSITFVIRFLAVNAQPAPPSEDLGGDLIVLHSYTEKNPVFPYFRYEAPPLYYFVIVLPLTMLFSPITGLKVIDALVPSILIFPFYFFCKIVVNQRPASIIAASLFAFSEAFNEMMGWGGTLNMFAFTFAIGSLYFLVKLMQRQQRNDALLLATFISLTIGTHHLTALFVGITTILALGVSYLPQLKLKPSTKTYGLTAAFAVILSVPYIPYYVSLSANSVNIGPTYSLPFQDILYTLVYTNARTNLSVLLLIGTSTIGFVSSMMIVQRRPGVVVALAAGFASGLLTLFLNPAIYNRAAYFLPISIFVGVGGCLALLASSVRNGSQVL